MRKRGIRRTAAAILVAPFPVALVQSVVVGIWPKPGRGVFENPPSMFLALCLYFYLAAMLLGGPAWLILRKRLPAGPRPYAIMGAVIGFAPVGTGLALMSFQGRPPTLYLLMYDLLLLGVGGAVAGLVFWWIRIRRAERPNLEAIFD